MTLWKRLSHRIEDQNWDHVTFLRNILLVLGIVILLFYLWIFMLNLNGIISPDYFVYALSQMIRGHTIGLAVGVVVLFIFLLSYYTKQEWDLHIVVPQALFFHVISAVLLFIVGILTSFVSTLLESSLLTGYLLGGMLSILAYAGEVKREHD